MKTVPNFFVWCTADGQEPIDMTLAHSSTPLASGLGLVYAKITQRGNYTCTARNEIGMVSRDFTVVVIGKKRWRNNISCHDTIHLIMQNVCIGEIAKLINRYSKLHTRIRGFNPNIPIKRQIHKAWTHIKAFSTPHNPPWLKQNPQLRSHGSFLLVRGRLGKNACNEVAHSTCKSDYENRWRIHCARSDV